MILDDILDEKKKAVSESRQRFPLPELEQQAAAADPPRGFARALRAGTGMACIAEFKRRSPSKGWIHQSADPAAVAAVYEAAGAAAMSVLTDTPFFGGEIEDLRRARAAIALPVLRKDFVIDPYQIVEARAAGADAVLLIVAALGDRELGDLLAEAHRLRLDALVETHDSEEVRRALAAGATIIGINHRDLRTFDMNMDLAVNLRPSIPADCVVVAESGLRSHADVEKLERAGVDAILVGETLMQAPDPVAALRELLGRR
jgi:indole-3-glycerol phosphate synthase